MIYRRVIKRIFDCVVSLVSIILALPILIMIIPFVYISNKGAIFFVQVRSGLNGKPFRLYKLKTMSDNRDSAGKLLSDSQRLTSFGKFLRSLSIDELPQLINVITGDMSLVGPRPLLTDYLPLYNSRQASRHSIRPGITGWAQVNGRNSISWNVKFEMDLWYVENMNFRLDLKILLLTMLRILKRKGISSTNTVTMERFQGSFANDEAII
jgi:lipopolysaccharide/colanic/teichoic acid biosynthesis glycosyltransferase